MNWETLFSNRRVGSTKPQEHDAVRGDYMRDYDRLIFSPHFRRLQHKTQVFPLSGATFVHNRLTHSLEVASVGRSLGRAVGEQLAAKYAPQWSEAIIDFYRFELAAVISTACIAHDIGNPPFGHSGEKAIRSFFAELDDATKSLINSELTENQWNDLLHFEGNANAFRLLTSGFVQNGLSLTYTTLASIIKYPSDSTAGFNKKTGWISTKKSGYFDEESNYFQEVAESLGLPNLTPDGRVKSRHPFVFLMEAADDICYRIIDLEDAYQLGILSTTAVEALLVPLFSPDTQQYLQGKLPKIADASQRLAFLRAMLINHLTTQCAAAFLAHEEALLQGTLHKSLIDLLDKETTQKLQLIDEVSYSKIYKHPAVVEVEIAGYHVLGGLLKEFVQAVVYPDTVKADMLRHILPSPFELQRSKPMYNQLLTVIDYLTGMTDLEAIDLYRRITGIEMPKWRG